MPVYLRAFGAPIGVPFDLTFVARQRGALVIGAFYGGALLFGGGIIVLGREKTKECGFPGVGEESLFCACQPEMYVLYIGVRV